MIEWTELEYGSLLNFTAAPGALRSALEKFTAEMALFAKAQCAASMATVPRDPERAADHAARAQAFDEFWSQLADALTNFRRTAQEPTLGGKEEE